MKRISIVVLAFLLLPLVSLAEEVTGAKIVAYGIYTNKTVSTEKSENAPTPARNLIDNIVFTETTTRIPAQKGIHFGFRFILDGTPSGNDIIVIKKVSHPAITENNRTYTSHEYGLTYALGTEQVTGYTFGLDNVIVPGDWTFQIFFNGKKLLEQTFTVYKP